MKVALLCLGLALSISAIAQQTPNYADPIQQVRSAKGGWTEAIVDALELIEKHQSTLADRAILFGDMPRNSPLARELQPLIAAEKVAMRHLVSDGTFTVFLKATTDPELIDRINAAWLRCVSEPGDPIPYSPVAGRKDVFPDVPENHWIFDTIALLKAAGILVGYPDGLIRNRPLSPEETIRLLVRGDKEIARLHASRCGLS